MPGNQTTPFLASGQSFYLYAQPYTSSLGLAAALAVNKQHVLLQTFAVVNLHSKNADYHLIPFPTPTPFLCGKKLYP